MNRALKIMLGVIGGFVFLLSALLFYLLKTSITFIILFYFIIGVFITGFIILLKVFRGMQSKPQEQQPVLGVDYESAASKAEELMLHEVAVQVGEVYERGVQRTGREGEEKTPIFLLVFKDQDSSQCYAVGVNVEDNQVRKWVALPRKRQDWRPQIDELLNSLSRSSKEYSVRKRTRTDNFGNTYEETETVPFYGQAQKKEEEQGGEF